MNLYRVLTAVMIILWLLPAQAQILEPVNWTITSERIDDATFRITATATIDEDWYVYSHYIESGGPIPTKLELESPEGFETTGKLQEIGDVESGYDEIFEMELKKYQDSLVLTQDIRLTAASATAKGYVEFMTCDDTRCLPPEAIPFSFDLQRAGDEGDKTQDDAGTPSQSTDKDTSVTTADTSAAVTASSTPKDLPACPTPVAGEEELRSDTQQSRRGLIGIFIAGFLGGLVALITPCVLPMIPLTVSYFTKRGGSKSSGFASAALYGLSIIVIYVSLGMVVTKLLGSDAMNQMASNVWLNLAFFALLVIFAISFFGAFELRLPNSWINKADRISDKGGVIGIFFMAFTLALVSFSCTGPIIGTLLVETAIRGSYMGPMIGMAGFSVALAVPFTVFAGFPSWLTSLPKSGGWMNAVKVTLGFLELALALKFLSNVDLAYHWGILTREVFLSLWIIIFGLLGIYLLGKLRLPLDPPATNISVTRLMLAIFSLTFAVYLVPGLWGAPVKLVSGLAPPSFYKEWQQGSADKGDHCPHGLNCFHDYEAGLAYARRQNKPVLLDFTGWTCVNCRKMEDNVWSEPPVLRRLSEDYVLVSLYVDDKKPLPKAAQYVSAFSDKKITTVGKKWSDFQASCFGANSQPYYILLTPEEEMLLPPRGYTPDAGKFLTFLEEGLARFTKQ